MFDFNDAELEALDSGVYSKGIFFRLDTDPAVRLWLGFGDIKPGVNVFDPDGALYQGFGAVRDIPVISQLINGTAERQEFTLSGVDDSILALATGDDADRVKGKAATLGFALMDERWRLLGGLHWCAFYTADYLTINRPVVDGKDSPIVQTVTLSVGTRFTARRRPTASYWSDADQQTRWPGDLSCSHVVEYTHGFNKPWPVFS
ncbi:hypothetical protein [Bradyrhizobium sp. BR 1433]|uniref:hypothetical protein n=1 Tax=Bradyrhizobium sp. BR 1433 TaxID=3447967 RepID=UPI003EE7248D